MFIRSIRNNDQHYRFTFIFSKDNEPRRRYIGYADTLDQAKDKLEDIAIEYHNAGYIVYNLAQILRSCKIKRASATNTNSRDLEISNLV